MVVAPGSWNDLGHSPHGECGLKFTHSLSCQIHSWGHSPHGECGLKSVPLARPNSAPLCHSPHGECGLKYIILYHLRGSLASLPAWGVWIEITGITILSYSSERHSPHGECGLKFRDFGYSYEKFGHSPHGECGLKSVVKTSLSDSITSLPAWGVWIEISNACLASSFREVTPRMGSVD